MEYCRLESSGRTSRSGPAEYAMPESPLLFSSLVPASEYSQEVEVSKSRGAGDPAAGRGPEGGAGFPRKSRHVCHSRESGNPSFSRPSMGPRFRGDDDGFRSLGWAVSPSGVLALSTPHFLDYKNRGNKARMSMKTKEEDKKSPSLGRVASRPELDGSRLEAVLNMKQGKVRHPSELILDNLSLCRRA